MSRENMFKQVGSYDKSGEVYSANGNHDPKLKAFAGSPDIKPAIVEADLNHQPQFNSDVVDHEADVICVDEHRQDIRDSEDYKYQNQYPYNLKPRDKNVERQQRAIRAEEKARILPKKPDKIYN